MKRNLRFALCLALFWGFLLPATHAQFVNFEETWKEFLSNSKTSNISKLTKPSKEMMEDYAKYCLMYANSHFCAGEMNSAENMMREIKNIGEGRYSFITGYKPRHDDLRLKMDAYYDVENLWRRFLRSRDVSLAELDEVAIAKKVCEKGTLAKYFYMVAHAHYCKEDIADAKYNFENRVLKLAERTSLKVGDIEGLEAEVKTMKVLFQNLPKLGLAWKKYIETDVSDGFDIELPVVECYPVPSFKEYVLRAAFDLCKNGPDMLEKIQKLRADYTQPIDGKLAEKIKWLESEVEKSNRELATLEKAWNEFVPDDTLTSGIEYVYDYCRKDALVKAYVMDGLMNTCEKGQEMFDKIAAVQKEHNPPLNDVVVGKIKKLENRIKKYEDEAATLDQLWGDFIQNGDTLLTEFQLADFYCDDIAQIKSWVIKGHFDPCGMGQSYMDKINDLQKSENLTFDDELACRVLRLRIKVWDCRYWELVLQARAETHAERERFGPLSADIMRADLNSDELPCETTVQYEPLGNIGIKYVITTYLCQEIDLAKMGDPEYYKKIAAWVDTEVLQKYCEESLRCKEDFFIYLEGHTDGNAFRGASYKNSLNIPDSTAFTHYWNGEAIEKTTEREITTTLKSNMELGIARAWTVKQQLDFMEVPITIGAYEHPESEKGGEYRSVEIELNITNLLLDFYEKRLHELHEASGIGERPEGC